MGPTGGARELGTPLFLLNLKSYLPALGNGALAIGRNLEEAGRRHRVSTAIAPSAASLGVLSRELRIPVLAQHVDPLEPGARTGFLIPASLSATGVAGSLLNHSEHPIPPAQVLETSKMLRASGLVSIVCSGDLAAATRLARASRPPFLAIEPPELIGGSVSVSVARPEIVRGAVERVRRVSPRTRVLCGAGVKTGEDVRRAIELGAEGILVSSAVAAAQNPAAAIAELMRGFKA
ncbi:MAG: triose-phosphate isomerase [Nitrososphaerota archaeon]|nr:triose-phosphate isomerase [Nitrososphaerota archaeon]